MYAKLIDGVLQYAPKNFLTESGQYIANFNNNEDLMIKEIKVYEYKVSKLKTNYRFDLNSWLKEL